MSHVAAVQLEILDLKALKATAERLGFEFVENKKNFKWYGRWLNDWRDNTRAAALQGFDPKTFGTCEHVIRIPGGDVHQYEIGVVKARSGNGYELIYDAFGAYGAKLEQMGGQGMVKFKQPYGIEVAKRLLIKKGYRVNEIVKDGRIRLQAVNARGSLIAQEVDEAGNVSIETKGFTGSDCIKETMELERALGRKTGDMKTAEYYKVQSKLEVKR